MFTSKSLHDGFNLHITPDAYVFDPVGGSPHTNRRLFVSRKSGDIFLNSPGAGELPAVGQVLPVFGIVGILSLSTADVLIVITSRSPRGRIDGQTIYLATDFRVLPLLPASSISLLNEPAEKQLLSLVEHHLYQGDFWFSYGWDLTNRLQAQALINSEGKALWEVADDRFFWNRYLHSRFIDITMTNPKQDLSAFILPIMYGSFDLRPTHIDRIPFLMCLISRRSRYRAGTRYFARGLDSRGDVANFNETEQIILLDASPLDSIPSRYAAGFGAIEGRTRLSFVQTRGSAPIGFAEINNLRYVPDLTIMETPTMEQAFTTHMESQISLYGEQVLVNLVNSKGREKMVKEAYERRVEEAKIPGVQYHYFDFHKECSKMRFDRISLLVDRLEPVLRDGGYFHQSVSYTTPLNVQKSVVRSNCMDCLDRTNVTQAAIAKWSLTRQLRAAGILSEKDQVDNHENFMIIFRTMWADHADYISTAYSGTPALKTDFTRTGKRTYEGLGKDFMSSYKRYLKNNFYDGDRQDAFDLVTGAWIAKGGPSISLALVDSRPPVVRTMPYVLGLSIAVIFGTLSLPQSLATSLAYLRTLCFILAMLSAFYIFTHGVEYVAWPRLNPPTEVIHYDGPGYRSPQRGRGRIVDDLPVPKWLKKNLEGSIRKTPAWNKMEEIEMGTKMRVD